MTNRDVAGLAKGAGITATDPRASITADQHIAGGVKPSQFVSTTKNLATAQKYSGSNGIAVIDPSKVPNKADYSWGSLNLSLRGNFNAIRDSEVLVERHIPQAAIIRVIPGGEE